MTDRMVMARVVDRPPIGLIVIPIAKLQHPDTCWCRPPDVALAAQKKAEQR